jgi:phosphoribosylanthranilate isomerase
MVVKICGITNRDDALAAVEHGATALGFNFYPKSPRYVEPAEAARLIEELPPDVWKVGVFVNEPEEKVSAIAAQAHLDIVQLHGDACATGVRTWRALPVKADFRLEQLSSSTAEAFLLDAPSATLYGGTGETFDWSRVAGSGKRIILAGGLDASNVGKAIRVARPWGVDACSRLESSPGRKDHTKMAQFLKMVVGTQVAK